MLATGNDVIFLQFFQTLHRNCTLENVKVFSILFLMQITTWAFVAPYNWPNLELQNFKLYFLGSTWLSMVAVE